MTFDEDHPGLKPMNAAQVAEGIYDATVRRTRTAILSPRAKVLDAIHVVSPALLERIQKYK